MTLSFRDFSLFIMPHSFDVDISISWLASKRSQNVEERAVLVFSVIHCVFSRLILNGFVIVSIILSDCLLNCPQSIGN
jgi:hypothetical protein